MRKERFDYNYEESYRDTDSTTAYAGHNDNLYIAGYEMDQDVDYRSIRSYGLATMW